MTSKDERAKTSTTLALSRNQLLTEDYYESQHSIEIVANGSKVYCFSRFELSWIEKSGFTGYKIMADGYKVQGSFSITPEGEVEKENGYSSSTCVLLVEDKDGSISRLDVGLDED
jgi:hypothetical protein